MTKEEIIKEFLNTWQYLKWNDVKLNKTHYYMVKPANTYNNSESDDNKLCTVLEWEDAIKNDLPTIICDDDTGNANLFKVWELTENATIDDFQ